MTWGVAALVAVAVLVVVVLAVVLARRRRRPSSLEQGIAAFAREMQALAPEKVGDPARTAPTPPSGHEPAAAGDEPGR